MYFKCVQYIYITKFNERTDSKAFMIMRRVFSENCASRILFTNYTIGNNKGNETEKHHKLAF